MQPPPDDLYPVLADAAFEAIAILEGTTILWCNQAFEVMFRTSREDVVGRSPLEFAAEGDRAHIVESIRTGVTTPYEATGVRADGSRFEGELRGRQIEVDGRTLRVTTIRDLTRQRATERDLRRSEARYRLLFDAAADGILVMGHDAMPREVNDRLCELLGRTREEILAMTPADAIADLDERPMRLDRLGSERSYVVERQLLHSDGSKIDVEVNLTAVGPAEVLAVIRDVRERKRAAAQQAALRDQLQQAKHLEALGRFAGGVAHDFNNLLTVILAAAEHLQTKQGGRFAEDISDAARRAADLTASLLTFSQHRPSRSTRLEANAQLRALEPLLHRLLGANHRLSLALCDEELPIIADSSEITQIVMNLVLNARDAMPDGGRIDVELHSATGDGGRPELRLRVRDHGDGIPEGDVSRLFDPFFTTKAAGQGTGLGLSTVHGIANGLGGSVTVDTGPDGSCFEVSLPLRPPSGDTPEDDARSPVAVNLRVLLVEDEPAVRRTVAMMLRGGGHHVIEAGGVDEAMGAAAQEPWDVLLTDVVMPDGSGVQLARKLGAARVLFMSGYPRDELREREPHEFLTKPFSASELLAALERTALSHGRSAHAADDATD